MDFNALRDNAIAHVKNLIKEHLFDDLPSGNHPLSHTLPPTMSGYLPYHGWDAVKQLYQMETSCGLIIEVDPLGGFDETKQRTLGQMFNDGLPEGVHVQIMNWSSPKVGFKFDDWERARSQSGGIWQKLAQSRREFLTRGVYQSLSRSSPFYVRDYRVFMCFELKGFVDGEAGKALLELKETMRQTLLTLGAQSLVVNPDMFLDFVRSILNPTSSLFLDSKRYDPSLPLNEQVVAKETTFTQRREKITTTAWNFGDPYSEEVVKESAKTERFELRTFSIDKFPPNCDQNRMSRTIGDMFNARLQPVGSNLTVLYFSNHSYADTKSKVELKSIRMRQQAEGPGGKFFPTVVKAAKDWAEVNDDVAEGAKLANMCMSIVSTTPEGEGETAERFLKAVWLNAGFTIVRNDVMHLPTLVSCLPLTMGQGLSDELFKLKRIRQMPSTAMSLIAPMQGESLGFARPEMLLLGRRGQPFFWSPFSNEAEGAGGGNHNLAVIGSSGSGKSVAMQELVAAALALGAHAMVLDDGRSFANTCKILGGQFIDFDLNQNLCVNPFSMCDMERAKLDKEYMGDCKNGIRDTILQMARGSYPTLPEEIGIISEGVEKVWEEHGCEGNVDLVSRYLREKHGTIGLNLSLSMNDYISGGVYYDLFNGTCNLEIRKEFIVFELSPLEAKKDLRAVVILTLLMLTAQRMKFVDRQIKKLLVIDEAWKLLGDGAAGPYIEGFARRCRKMGGALITGTQSLQDYERTAGSKACIQNSDWMMILRLKPEALSQFSESNILRVSEGEMEILRSLRTQQGEYSECFIKGPGCQIVGRLAVDPYTLTLYSTKPEVLGAVEHLIREGHSVEDAVYMVAYKKAPPKAEVINGLTPQQVVTFYPEIAEFASQYLRLDERQRRLFINDVYHRRFTHHDAA